MADLITSNVTAGGQTLTQIASLESAALIDRGFLPGIYKRHGRAFGFYDILTAANQVVDLPSQDTKVVEKLAPVRVLKTKTAITAASGNLTMELHDDNFESGGTTTVARVGFIVYFPQKYMPAGVREDRGYMITAIGDGDRTNSSLTLAPVSADGTSKTATALNADLPASTELSIGHSMFAPGSTGPTGLRDFPTTRTYKTGFIREAQEFDGSFFAHKGETIEIDGQYLKLDPVLMESEMRLRDQKESAVIWAEENDNALLVQTSTQGGVSGVRKSSRGLLPWLDIAGQALYYTDGDFSIFNDIIDTLQTQGVYSKTVTLFCAPRFAQMLSDEGHEYIRDYSGGTNLWDAAEGKIGFTPTVYEYGQVKFYVHTVASFMKPASYGYIDSDDEAQYVAGNICIAVPDGKVTVNEWGNLANVSIPNLWMGYVNRNGENRRNMIGRIKGLNGMGFEGIDIANDGDGFKYCWGSHYGFGGAEWNKMVIVRKNIAKAV